MNWSKNLSELEIWFIVAFVLLYGIYIGRCLYVTFQLKSSARSIVIKLFLRSIYFGLLIASLLGPTFGESKRDLQASGHDVYMLVNLSKTIDEKDVAPSRLEKVKFELLKLLPSIKSDRVGIVIYGQDAYLHTPLTYDQQALNLFISSLNSNLVAERGQNVEKAISIALSKFKKSEMGKDKSKVLLLISDTCVPEQDSQELRNTLKTEKIGFISIGVGTSKKAPYLSDCLKKWSQSLNGAFVEVTSTASELNEIPLLLDDFQRKLYEQRSGLIRSNKYAYFLGLALLLMCLDILLTVRTFQL